MIVVDTNILVYLWFPTEFSLLAEKLLTKDQHWVSVPLWRSELRNVCLSFVRQEIISFEDAVSTVHHVEEFMNKNEFTVSSFSVLNHVHRTKCTAYDCEYVSLAESLKVPLITRNKEILKRFPNLAVRLEDYV